MMNEKINGNAGKTLSREGRDGYLTPDQQASLRKLRSQLVQTKEFYRHEDLTHFDNVYILRFLRACNWDLVKTKSMILEAERWRLKMDCEGLYHTFKLLPEEHRIVQEVWPQFYHGVDKFGRPAYWQGAPTDSKKFFATTTTPRMAKYFAARYESVVRDKIPACAAAAGDPLVDQLFVVFDLRGATLTQNWAYRTPFKTLIDISQLYQPELSGRVLVINAPPFFKTIWKMVKAWLSQATIERVSVHGSDYLPVLLQYMDRDQIPAYLGGTCKNNCRDCALSDWGPWSKGDGSIISEEGYAESEISELSDGEVSNMQ